MSADAHCVDECGERIAVDWKSAAEQYAEKVARFNRDFAVRHGTRMPCAWLGARLHGQLELSLAGLDALSLIGAESSFEWGGQCWSSHPTLKAYLPLDRTATRWCCARALLGRLYLDDRPRPFVRSAPVGVCWPIGGTAREAWDALAQRVEVG